MRRVSISSTLSLSADEAFRLALRYDTFLFVTRGAMRVVPLAAAGNAVSLAPKEWRPGDHLTLSIRLLHLPVAYQHELAVERVDPVAREISTREHGGLMKAWNHTLRFEAAGAHHCRYTDEVDIDAGWLTLPVCRFARLFFRYRQWRWRRLIAESRR
ncbi:MAG: hypothetical protein K1X71_12350 [Pirellulales bacterium]|nr:hypothetical protein [Pirellulales bacterium]